eukprot:scaffold927_cov375-Prasinococcus_capsulatus_cf.AAC.11
MKRDEYDRILGGRPAYPATARGGRGVRHYLTSRRPKGAHGWAPLPGGRWELNRPRRRQGRPLGCQRTRGQLAQSEADWEGGRWQVATPATDHAFAEGRATPAASYG